MSSDVNERRPGQFAQEHFEQLRGAWLRRVWWALPLVGLLVAAAPLLIAVAVAPEYVTFFAGMGIGAATGMIMTLVLTPPPHIENWRQGAEGERATAKALRPLTREGWVLVNDIQTDRGNIDHVLIGPSGVYLLETKKLGGVVSVADDKLRLRWRDAPDDGYVLDRVGVRARGQAAALHERFRAAGIRPGWLQAVVVVWAPFEQRVVDADRTLWVHGAELATVLRSRPTRLGEQDIAEAAALLSRMNASAEAGAP
jgi:hypothetical protein